MGHYHRTNKKKSLAIHTKRRLFERFGREFNSQEIKDMAAMCKSGHYLCHLGKQSLTRSKIVIKFQNEIFPVIYDKSRHCIITVLTLDMLSKQERNFIDGSLECI